MKNKINQIKEAIKRAEEKAKVIGSPRREKLYVAIEKIKDYLHFIENPNPIYDLIRDYEDQCNRVCLNNEKKGISTETSIAVLRSQNVQMPKLLEAVVKLADIGDPLAIKIKDCASTLVGLTNFSDEAIYRLINRTMGEQDYYNYLEGALPIVRKHNGEDVYLDTPKKIQVEETLK